MSRPTPGRGAPRLRSPPRPRRSSPRRRRPSPGRAEAARTTAGSQILPPAAAPPGPAYGDAAPGRPRPPTRLDSCHMSSRSDILRRTLAQRVVVADGAMGTMLQAADPSLDDFEGHEGCNEVLNVTRPDVVRSVHEEYFAVGVDCVETNTFGANLAALGEYDIPERVFELSESGARIAREVADEFTASTGQQRWVLGSMGPGTKLPTLGHAPYDKLRDAYQRNAEGMITGGADALIVETTQDLLQTK